MQSAGCALFSEAALAPSGREDQEKTGVRALASTSLPLTLTLSPRTAGESHLANKRLFCCGKSILGVLR
ncbi:hypothetical protein CN243_19315 [Sinorhizobium meliloti]|nr:hypothetical protein CN243_19315 [Sinorhizobium meliloti]